MALVKTQDKGHIQAECYRLAVLYALYVDEREWEALADLFTENARFARPTAPDAPIMGRRAIYESFANRPVGRTSRHLVSNFAITEWSNEAVGATCYVTAYMGPAPDDEAPIKAEQILVGGFHDIFEMTDDGWRIAARTGFVTFKVEG